MNELFLFVLNTGIAAGWLILAVLVLRLLLYKSPKWTRLFLWAVVGIRLLLAFPMESPWSLLPTAQTIPPDIATAQTPAIESGLPAINQVVNPILSHNFAPTPQNSANPLQVWLFVGQVVWLVGIGAMAVYLVLQYWRIRRQVATATKLQEGVYQSDAVSSPFLLGVVKPSIYLPYGMAEATTGYVISHEQAHIRRKDHWWKLIGFLLLCIYWFHPLVWVAYGLLCKDIELACDEAVIKGMNPQQRAEYSQALLDCSQAQRKRILCPLAFGEVGVKERVKGILNYKKPGFWLIVLAFVVAIVVAVGFLTNPLPTVPTISINFPTPTPAPTPENLPQEVLNQTNAEECIQQVLDTLVVSRNMNEVSFSLPESIPVSEDGKTRLTIDLSLTYSTGEPSTYTTQRLLEGRNNWQGGESYSHPVDTDKGELKGVSMRVAFMTEVGENAYQEYAAKSTELLIEDTSNEILYFGLDPTKQEVGKESAINYTLPEMEASKEGNKGAIAYTLADGSKQQLLFDMPQGASFAPLDESTPDTLVVVDGEGKPIFSVSVYPMGAYKEDLQQVDTAQNSLPMQVFSTVALSNHAGYEEYQVQSHSPTGAVATAQYVWQELSDQQNAAAIPTQQLPCVLVYDWQKMPYFVQILWANQDISTQQQIELANSIAWKE